MTAIRYRRALERLLASPTLPKLGLRRMGALMAALAHPERRYRVVHIAGTKGKGSTAAMTASILRAAGLKVGLTISPHLLSARERIVVDGDLIGEDVFVDLEERVAKAAAGLDAELDVPSFFERMVAMAFCAFADADIDVAVVEVGLGGRLDATNVVVPTVTAITRLGLDHQEFLGDTLALIAGEKAGIIKEGAAAFTVAQLPEALAALQERADHVGVDLVAVPVDGSLRTSLFGDHQQENASLAAAVARAAHDAVDDDAVVRGLATVQWPGRYEVFDNNGVLVILDGAHNVDSAIALRRALDSDARLLGLPRQFVIGMSRGHDIASFVTVAAGAAGIVAARAAQPRAVAAADIARVAARVVDVVDAVDDVAAAVDVACARAGRGVVVVTGSLFVVGEARAALAQVPMPRDPARPAW